MPSPCSKALTVSCHLQEERPGSVRAEIDEGRNLVRDQSERRALAGKYKQLADEANGRAAKATTEAIRDDYLRLALGWLQLADDLEKSD
jgi:hypothetical protein